MYCVVLLVFVVCLFVCSFVRVRVRVRFARLRTFLFYVVVIKKFFVGDYDSEFILLFGGFVIRKFLFGFVGVCVVVCFYDIVLF